ncbi:MAG: hypothetical protein ACF8MF_04500 [Phycisphaerales bacterium JB052]
MGTGARVTDIEALRAFRPALIKFSEDAQRAITSPGSDAGRVMTWLQQDRLPFWKREIRVRSEAAVVAKSKLVQQTSSESPRPSVDARKAFELAKRRVREAEEKYEQTRRAVLHLQKEIERYRGAVQPMASIARADMKNAVGRIDRMVRSLEEYTRTGTGDGNVSANKSGAERQPESPGEDE